MNERENEKLNSYVKRSVDCGVKPIEMLFEPLLDCDFGEAVAYRSYAKINSVITGVLMPEDYLNANISGQVLTDMSLRLLKKAVASAVLFNENRVKYSFLTIKCPSSLVFESDLYSKLKSVLNEFSVYEGEKKYNVCLEFDSSVMQTEGEKLKEVFADIKAAGLKIAVSGYGGDDFAMEKLLSACPDVLFTDERVVRLVKNREKFAAIAPVINFAKSLGGVVIADGVSDDEELREFRTRECFGFIPSESYKGRIEPMKSPFTLGEILAFGESYDGE